MKKKRQEFWRQIAAFGFAVMLGLNGGDFTVLAAGNGGSTQKESAGESVESVEATTAQLTKTEGTVTVSQASGKKVTIIRNMRLLGGYRVSTAEESYAWAEMDKSKLLKVDAVSGVSVRKNKKILEILLDSGNMFFNVTEPLSDDETMNICTSSMIAGIRGTCGWVKVVDKMCTRIYLLEGKLECTVTDPVTGQAKMVLLKSGEWADFYVYDKNHPGDKCDIIMERFGKEDVPGFVLVELAGDQKRCEEIFADSGIDLRSLTKKEAKERLKEDERTVRQKVAVVESAAVLMASNISQEPVWNANGGGTMLAGNNPAPAVTATPAPGATPAPAPTAAPAPDVTPAPAATETPAPSETPAPRTIDIALSVINQNFYDIIDALNNHDEVNVFNAGAGVWLIDDYRENLIVESSKKLTLKDGISLDTSGAAMEVRGTLHVTGGLTNRGSITVTSPNTLEVDGAFTNEDSAVLAATDKGRIVGHQGITNNGGVVIKEQGRIEGALNNQNWKLDKGALTVEAAGANGSLSADAAWLDATSKFGIDITSVSLSDSVKSIPAGAFEDCTELTTINLNQVTSVEPGAFAYCISLTSFTVPTSNTKYSVKNNMLYDGNTLVLCPAGVSGNIQVPAGTVNIDEKAFADCEELKTVTIPAGVTTIGAGAFPSSLGELVYDGLKDDAPAGMKDGSAIASGGDTKISYNYDGDGKAEIVWMLNKNTRTLTLTVKGGSGTKEMSAYEQHGPWADEEENRTKHIEKVVISEGITSVSANAFKGCTALKEVTWGENVAKVHETAFDDCTGLEEITLPSNVEIESVGREINIFSGCTSLKTITCVGVIRGHSNRYEDLNGILCQAYDDSDGIAQYKVLCCPPKYEDKEVDLSLGGSFGYVRSIGQYAFKGCSGLTKLDLGSGLYGGIEMSDRSDTDYAKVFRDCTSLTEIHVYSYGEFTDLDAGVLADQNGTLFYVPAAKAGELVVPDSVNTIKTGALFGCTKLTSLRLGKNTEFESTGDDAVYQEMNECSALGEIDVAAGHTKYMSADGILYSADGKTLYYCPRAKAEMDPELLPGGIGTIKPHAFANSALDTLLLRKSVNEIGAGAFEGSSLATVLYSGSEDDFSALMSKISDESLKIKIQNKQVTVTYDESLPENDAILLNSGVTGDLTWELYKFIDEDGKIDIVLYISGSGAMADYENEGVNSAPWGVDVTRVSFDYGVTYIGNGALYGTKIASVDIPNTVTKIGDYAFADCDNLKEVNIGYYSDLSVIGEYAFYKAQMSSLTVSDTLTEIGDYAFAECSKLTRIFNFSDTALTRIGNSAFYNDVYLKADSWYTSNITLPSSVQEIGNNAFYNCCRMNFVIPEDSQLTDIGSFAFMKCAGITDLVLPEGITYIPWQTFTSCSGLKSVTFMGDITNIGFWSFRLCSSLNEVNFKGKLTRIDQEAFSYCGCLNEFVLPGSLESIGDNAFQGCSQMKCFYYDGREEDFNQVRQGSNWKNDKYTSVTFMVQGYGDCSADKDKDKVEWDLYHRFYKYYDESNKQYCKEYYDVLSITGTGAMKDYTSAEDVPWKEYYDTIQYLEIGEGVTHIGEYAFGGMTAVKDIDVGTNPSFMLDNMGVLYTADGKCLILAPRWVGGMYTIPDGVERIASGAFAQCSSLLGLSIPKTVREIGENAFAGIGALAVSYAGSEADWNNPAIIDIKRGNEALNGNLSFNGEDVILKEGACGDKVNWTLFGSGELRIAGEGAMEDYPSGAIPWGDMRGLITSAVIEKGVTTVGDYAFFNCANLGSVTISDTVTSIGKDAFFMSYGSYNYVLESIKIPDSVTSIGIYAFYGCTGLKNVTLSTKLTSIEESLFQNCSSLESITIPGSVTSIGQYAFRDCYSLKNVEFNYGLQSIGYYAFNNCNLSGGITIPDSVTSIGENAFYYCKGAKNLVIGSGVTTIGSYVFYGCEGLESVTIPSGVTSIGQYAFAYCYGLNNVEFPDDGLQSIGSYAFEYCNLLNGITIPDSVASIGNSAFYYCKGAKTLEIGSGVTTIDSYVFYRCEGLESVTISSGVTSIGNDAFEYCYGLTKITIPSSVTAIGNSAFYACRNLTDVYFDNGTKSQWINNVKIDPSYNDPLLQAIVHAKDGEILGDGTDVPTSNMMMLMMLPVEEEEADAASYPDLTEEPGEGETDETDEESGEDVEPDEADADTGEGVETVDTDEDTGEGTEADGADEEPGEDVELDETDAEPDGAGERKGEDAMICEPFEGEKREEE